MEFFGYIRLRRVIFVAQVIFGCAELRKNRISRKQAFKGVCIIEKLRILCYDYTKNMIIKHTGKEDKYMKYTNTVLDHAMVSQVALGCMRIGNMDSTQADEYLEAAIDLGYNFFDHADIYGGGTCEKVFGMALKRNPHLRDKIFIQTKCAIKNGMYDFSMEHIISSVEGSLSRLNTEKIDVLLLHRPDLLMEPEEVAEAFDKLYTSGKVVSFGVSNHSPMQIELLKKFVNQKLIINQLQLSVVNARMISSGASVNTDFDDGMSRDGYVRDYCRLNDITVQPWSPLQHGFIKGPFLNSQRFSETNKILKEMGEKYGVSDTGMAIAWLLRLPEKMQPIVGSTNISRLKEIAQASEITLSAEDWYKIYTTAGYQLP